MWSDSFSNMWYQKRLVGRNFALIARTTWRCSRPYGGTWNKKWPDLKNWWILHHDNAWLHTAAVVQAYLEWNNNKVLSHLPYSPDLMACDYWLFPTLKKAIQGRHFNSDVVVVNAAHIFFNSLSQEDLKKITNVKWAERMERYVSLGGQYFELSVVIVSVMLAMFEINLFLRIFFYFHLRGVHQTAFTQTAVFPRQIIVQWCVHSDSKYIELR